jgi:hypothetical protein
MSVFLREKKKKKKQILVSAIKDKRTTVNNLQGHVKY